MTSKHRHGNSVYTTTGDVDARLDALEAAVAKLQPVPPPIVTPPPVIPPDARVITPADNIAALIAAGSKNLLLRAGTYNQSFGSTHRLNDGTVTLTAYPGDPMPFFDGTGKAQNFVYLGAGSYWTLDGIGWRNFLPTDSGVIGPGDGASLTMRNCVIRMAGAMQQNKHAVYFHGINCTGLIEDCDFEGAPGAALQSYRGSPVVRVNRGRYVGQYRGALIYSGSWTITGAEVRATGTTIDAEYKPGMLTLVNCGTVRTYVA